MGLLELCEKYFNSTNLYEVLGITENASEKEGKINYCYLFKCLSSYLRYFPEDISIIK